MQYLESRRRRLACEAKRCELENGNEPQLPSLSESDVAEVEGFLDEMLLCFPVPGVGIFERPVKPDSGAALVSWRPGHRGRGDESAQGFVVFAKSEAFCDEANSLQGSFREFRANLVKSGLLEGAGGNFVLTQDYRFSVAL